MANGEFEIIKRLPAGKEEEGEGRVEGLSPYLGVEKRGGFGVKLPEKR